MNDLKSRLNEIANQFKPLTNFDIDRIRKDLNIEKGEIINLDSEGPGTHWVAIFEENGVVYYFDSVGDSQVPELVQLTQTSIVCRNLKQYQDPELDPPICGHLCIKFLKCMNIYTLPIEKRLELFENSIDN